MEPFDIFLTILVGGITQILACFLLLFIFYLAPYPLSSKLATKELETNQIFRPMTDLRMGLYVPFISPFFHSALMIVAFIFFQPSLKLYIFDSIYHAGASFGFILWLLGPFPGIIIDYCSFKMSFGLALYFLISTFTTGILNGVVVMVMFARK